MATGRAEHGLRADAGPVEVRLLGRLSVSQGATEIADALGGRVGRLAFVYLLLARGRSVRRDELAAVLWEERVPANPTAALRVVLARLRRALGAQHLRGRAELRLELPQPVEVDVELLEAAVRRAEASGSEEDARRATELASGELLPGLDAGWLRAEREHVADLHERALAALARAALQRGRPGAAVARAAARELVRGAPFRETGHRLLIEAMIAEGDAAEALRAYDGLRVSLREELGAAPSAALQALHASLLEEGPTRTRGDVAAAERQDALARLQALVQRALAGERTLAWVTGAPGAGKSRLARELAALAHASGATVLWGRCSDDALVSYEPFVEIVRQYAASARDGELAAAATHAGPEFLALAPELARRVGATAAGARPGEGEQTRLLDSVRALIAGAAARRPVVMVIEDIHWADARSAAMLEHLVADTGAHTLVLCTARALGGEQHDRLAGVLRLGERIDLGG